MKTKDLSRNRNLSLPIFHFGKTDPFTATFQAISQKWEKEKRIQLFFLECNLKVSDVGNGRKMGQNRRRRTRYAQNAAPAAALYIGRRGRALQRTRSDARAAAEGKLQCARDHDLGSLVGKVESPKRYS